MAGKLLTTQEYAERFRTSPGTIRYWRHIGYGPHGIKIGSRVLYDEDEVEEFLRALRWQQTGKVAS